MFLPIATIASALPHFLEKELSTVVADLSEVRIFAVLKAAPAPSCEQRSDVLFDPVVTKLRG